jgi:hypothetical protein
LVSNWGPWTSCTGHGSTDLKLWSGGCRQHATGHGWRYYCLNGSDQNTAGGYGYTHGDSNFHVQKTGYWRINFFADHHGNNMHKMHHHVRVQVQGRDIYFNHDYQWHDGGWTQLQADVTWRVHTGWRIQISMHGSGGYTWHAWNHFNAHPQHSRAQFIYLGDFIQMWSGGCRNHCQHCTGWNTYCLNGQDTWESTHSPGDVMSHDHWKIYTKKNGFYRVNFFAIQHGCPGHWHARILRNGHSIHQTHNYRNWQNGHGWSTTSMDQLWWFDNGNNMQIQLYSPSNGCNQYLWHAWNNYGQHSRVQMTFKGSSLIMWSGGCAQHGISSGWHDYCINRSDFNHCRGSCWSDSGSLMYLRKEGFWSVKFYSIQHGKLYGTRVRFQENNRDILYSHNYKWTNTGWTQMSGDIVWFFVNNHHVRISLHADQHGYMWHAWGGTNSWSRVQYHYVSGAQGSRNRQRFIKKNPLHGGNACPKLMEKHTCIPPTPPTHLVPHLVPHPLPHFVPHPLPHLHAHSRRLCRLSLVLVQLMFCELWWGTQAQTSYHYRRPAFWWSGMS